MLELLAVVSIIVSCVSTVVHTVVTYKKSKEPPKDEVWETALRITASQLGGACDTDQFARNYEELKAFKDNGCSMAGHSSLHDLVKSASQKTCGQSGQPPKEIGEWR